MYRDVDFKADYGGPGQLGAPGHPLVYSKYEANLSYMKSCLEKKKKKSTNELFN